MLTSENERWLREAYPGLIPNNGGVAGTIAFKAAYSRQTGRFLILSEQTSSEAGGVELSCQFKIRIEERSQKIFSALPAVHVEDLEPTADRHFGQADKTACLCNPFEEEEFLKPEFDFRRFLERLVIPFLYGQEYYSRHHQWPWPEYAHHAAGLLEAYLTIHKQNRAEECLQKLKLDRSWPRIRAALQQKPHTKGHTPCFCPKADQMRRCHPRALEGILRLQKEISTSRIQLPPTQGDQNVSPNKRRHTHKNH
jgi:hypothetical protein